MNTLKKIAENLKKISKFEGYEYSEEFNANIKIPSFIIKAKIGVSKPKYTKEEDRIINQPIDVNIRWSDAEEVFNKLIPEALAKTINDKKVVSDKLSLEGYVAGSWQSIFPTSIHFEGE